jgi:hypothetical protein
MIQIRKDKDSSRYLVEPLTSTSLNIRIKITLRETTNLEESMTPNRSTSNKRLTTKKEGDS